MTAAKNTAKRQVPGFYRKQVGDFLVTAIYDGDIYLAPSLFHGLKAEDMQKLIGKKFQRQTPDGVPTSVTTYLIDTGDNLILLNAGGAKRVSQTMGNILDNLQAAGYSAEDISAVLLTHLHFDHVCGLVNRDGSAAFPNATVFASEDESNFWLNPEIAQAAPEANRPFFAMAVDSLAPYIRKGLFSTFKGEAQVLPGIQAVPSPGHTPGHTSFLVRSGSDKLLLWGDIVHSHALQFSHPEIVNDFDSDKAGAAASRKMIFQKAAQENLLIGGDHLPFPGFGHILENEEGYAWVPIEYATF